MSRDALAWLTIAVFGILALHPALAAGFVLVDDHEILSFTPGAVSDSQLVHATLIERIFRLDPTGGRVRPLYWVIRYAESAAFDANPTVWHVAYIGLGVASALLAYIALRGIQIARVPALLGGLWLLVSPGVSTVWIRLGPQESLGTLFTVVAFLLLILDWRSGHSRRWTWLFVFVATAATLTKESFALVPPALFGLSALLERRVRWQIFVPVLVGAIVAGVAFTTARLSGESYGGDVLNGAGLGVDQATLANIGVLTVDGGFLIPGLVLGLLIAAGRRQISSESVKYWVGGVFVVLILVVPQLALYRAQPGFAIGRYVLPAGLGLAAGLAAGLSWLRFAGISVMYVLLCGLWLASLIFGACWTLYDAESLRIDSEALSEMLDTIIEAPPGATLGIAVDPVRQAELAYSLPFHMAARGRPDLKTRVLAVTAVGDDADCTDFYAVVGFSNPATAQRPLPCIQLGETRQAAFAAKADPLAFTPPLLHDLFPPMSVTYWLEYP